MSFPENKTLIKRKKERKKEDQSSHPKFSPATSTPFFTHHPPLLL
jgi:hypothetical protein